MIEAPNRLIDWLLTAGPFTEFRAFIAASLLHRVKYSSDPLTISELAAFGLDMSLAETFTGNGLTWRYLRCRAGTNTIFVIPGNWRDSTIENMRVGSELSAFVGGARACTWAQLLGNAFIADVLPTVPSYHNIVTISDWSMGPVGFLAARWAFRNARHAGNSFTFGSVPFGDSVFLEHQGDIPCIDVTNALDPCSIFPKLIPGSTPSTYFNRVNFTDSPPLTHNQPFRSLNKAGRVVFVADRNRPSAQISPRRGYHNPDWLFANDSTRDANSLNWFVDQYLWPVFTSLSANEITFVRALDSINAANAYWQTKVS